MGGDFGPRCIVPASLSCLAEIPSLQLILVGQAPLLESLIACEKIAFDRSRLHVQHASEQIAMDDRPAQVLRGKPDASMRIALDLVRQGVAQACVSAGNTGALMALSRHILKTLPGVDRPAMVRAVPTSRGPCHLLDLGANVDCTAEHLYQFAVMGAVAAEALGTESPRVALLNVGTEEIKGNQVVKQAAALLQQALGLNYVGFVEGDGVYRGDADVVVCDGFVGNVLLKASEGLVTMVSSRVETAFARNPVTRLAGVLALPVLRRFSQEIAPARHNGASFLGLQGIVVKSHGSAGREGWQSAIQRAYAEVSEDLPRRLSGRLEVLLRQM